MISRKKSSKLLGISVGTFDMMRRRGLIEGVLVNKRLKFRRADVEALALTSSQRRALRKECGESVQ